MAVNHVNFEKFDDEVEDWNTYIERLEQHLIISDITDSKKKVAALLSFMGAKTYGLLRNLVAPGKPSEMKYEELIAVLGTHLNPKPLVIAERFRFYKRVQKDGEAIKEFCADLKKLSTNCDFGTNLSDSLRDRFVCGLLNEHVQKRLLSEDNLTYERAVEIGVAMEIAAKDTAELQSKPEHGVNKLTFRSAKSKTSTDGGSDRKCYRCGNSKHFANACKHIKTKCHLCSKMGHLKSQCRSQDKIRGEGSKEKHSVRQLDEVNLECADVLPMNVLMTERHRPYRIKVQINGSDVLMELDSGAAVSVMSLKTLQTLHGNLKMEEADILLRSYSGELLKPVGKVWVAVAYKKQVKHLYLYVTKQDGSTLFGRAWMEHFKIDWEEVKVNFVSGRPMCSVKEKLRSLLYTYKDLFDGQIGCLKSIKAQLHIKNDAIPVFVKARPVPYALENKISSELDRLENRGIISKVNHSDWSTPIVPVVKSNGDIRICGDFKVTVNPVLCDVKYPLPIVQDIFSKLAGGQYFTKLDVLSAYLHMEVAETDKKLLTINTHKGLYVFNRLLYGISTAPALWQKAMEQVLSGIPGVQVFLDDILVTGSDNCTHFERLKSVLQRLQEYGLKLNKSKCEFFKESLEYCGYKIDQVGLHKTESKVRAITNAPRPGNVTELKSFLGMVNYYGRFLRNVSTILNPLHKLLEKDTKFKWSKDCDVAFNKVKGEIASDRVLVHFDPKVQIALACDASPYGISAVLSHVYSDGDKPIAFASRTLTKSEKNYSQIDKEALALIWGVKYFYQYLYGRRFLLITDHKPLISIFAPNKSIPVLSATRLMHYALFLQAFKYDIKYKCSSEHSNADALSRLPLNSEQLENIDVVEHHQLSLFDKLPVTVHDIAKATQSDIKLKLIYDKLVSGESFTEMDGFKNKEHEFSLLQGCIMRGHKVVIPDKFHKQILSELHAGHFGIVKMKALARSFVWWPNIDNDIEKSSRACAECSLNIKEPPKVWHPWVKPIEPWDRIHIDFAEIGRGNYYCLVIDSYSKWPEVIKMKQITSETTILFLRTLFARYGLCKVLVSDNGPQFLSADFKLFLRNNGIKHMTSPAYHPASNGQVERYVQTFKLSLKKEIQSCKMSEDLALLMFLMQYRKTPNCTTNVSPAQLFLNRSIRTRLDLVLPTSNKLPVEKSFSEPQRKVREFAVGEGVVVRDYFKNQKWQFGRIVKKLSMYIYLVKVGSKLWRRHVNQIVKREVSNTIVTEVDPTGSPSCNSQGNGIPEIPVINKNSENTDMRTAESESPVEANSDQDVNPTPDVNVTVRKSQRTVAPPKRFEDFVMSK